MFGCDIYPHSVQEKFNEYYWFLSSRLSWSMVLPKYFDMRLLKKVHNACYTKCVLHGENSASLRFSFNLNIFLCYGCGRGGNIFKFIERMEGGNFFAMLFIRKHFGIPLPFTRKEWRAVKRYMIVEEKVAAMNSDLLEYTARNWKGFLISGSSPREEEEAIVNFLLSYEECEE